MIFKRKIYSKLLDWKQNARGEKALLIEGARRIGKSTIVEEFAKAEKSLKKAIEAYFCYDEIKYFCETFIDSFKKTLDELE